MSSTSNFLEGLLFLQHTTAVRTMLQSAKKVVLGHKTAWTAGPALAGGSLRGLGVSSPAATLGSAGGKRSSLAVTPFTAKVSLSSAKRFYAGVPVAQVTSDANVIQPPSDQAAYLKPLDNYNDQASRNFAYFMVGTYSFVGAMAAKNLITDYLVHFSASADVLAMAKVEVDMASVPEGKNVIIKWRGKPVFVRHRTADGMLSGYFQERRVYVMQT